MSGNVDVNMVRLAVIERLQEMEDKYVDNVNNGNNGHIGRSGSGGSGGSGVSTVIKSKSVADHIVGEHIRSPEQWRTEYGLHRGSAFGLAHSIDQLYLLRPRLRHPTIHNLYRVGSSTRPGNGVPLVMIGARLTSEAVIRGIEDRKGREGRS